MTIYNILHPRVDVDHLYIPSKDGRRGLISIQESIYVEEQCISRYIDASEEELLADTRRENILNDWNGEDNKQLKHWLRQECKQKCMTEPFHEQFLKQTQQISDSKSWAWLTTGGLKKETEGLFSRTAQVSRHQKSRTILIKPLWIYWSKRQWHQLGDMQICTSLQTYNDASSPLLYM